MSAAEKQRKQYLTTQITTASKEQLVAMLFDGIGRFCEVARKAYTATPIQIEVGGNAIQRAQAIVMELLYTLDREKGGEVAENLARLHAYAFKCLLRANLGRDMEKIDEVIHIYAELRDAWVGAMGALGLPTNVPSVPMPVAPARPAAATAYEAASEAAAPAAPTPATPAATPAMAPVAAKPAASAVPVAPAAGASVGGYGINVAAIAAASARRSVEQPAAVRKFNVNPAALAAALAAKAAKAQAAGDQAEEALKAAVEDAPVPDVASGNVIPAPQMSYAASAPAAAPAAAPASAFNPQAAAQYAQRVAMLAASFKRANSSAESDADLAAIPPRGAHAQAMAAYQRKLA